MTYYERPHRQAIGNFRMRKRPDFVPKGMSPLLDVGKRNDCKSLDVSLTDDGKIELLVALMSMQGEGDVERELARVKWQNYEGKYARRNDRFFFLQNQLFNAILIRINFDQIIVTSTTESTRLDRLDTNVKYRKCRTRRRCRDKEST